MRAYHTIKTALVTALLALSCALAAFHIGMTALYNLPANPIKTQTSLPERYINVMFSQNWQMFAPDPVSADMLVKVQCLTGVAGGEGSSEVYDIVSGFWDKGINNAFERMSRVMSNAAFVAITPNDAEALLLRSCENGTEKSCAEYRKKKAAREALGMNQVKRISAYFCADLSQLRGANYTHSNVWVSTRPVPRWSQRHDPPATWPREVKQYSISAYPLPPVRPLGVWSAG